MTRFYHSSEHPFRFISVSHNLFSIFRLALFTLMLIFVSSCEEDPTKIGSGLLPGNDFVAIFGTDTLSVRSYTVYADSVRTDNPAVSYLGQIYDPYFGTTTADFVTQLRLKYRWDGEPFTIDSVRMYLHIIGALGRTDVVHTLKLSEISDVIFPDSVYYSNKTVPLSGYSIDNIELPILRADTINDVTINLPNEFGSYITRDTSQLFYSPNRLHFSYAFPDFRSYFKGLYFQINPGNDPLLISLYLSSPDALNSLHFSSQNAIVIYMHDDANVAKEFDFILDADVINASFNRFSHDYSTADPDKRIRHINDGYRDTLSYLQSLNGVYTKITLPGLETLKNDTAFDKIAVNKSRLTIPVYLDGDIYKATTLPPRLILRYRTTLGEKYDVPDFSIGYSKDYDYSPFFDGSIDTTAKAYNFNIPAFVQGYLDDATGKVKPELEIFQRSGTRNVILKANKSKSPVKFEFTYTKF